MGLIVGMDEAGYGPNLGPLVVTACVWETDGVPRDIDFWKAFDGFAAPSPPADPDCGLHVGDSKAVYSPAAGLAGLETGVLAALALGGKPPATLRRLCERLGVGDEPGHAEPWRDDDVELPSCVALARIAGLARLWEARCAAAGLRLRTIQCDVVWPRRFNHLTRTEGNKAAALSGASLRLLARVLDPEHREPAFVVADKHGGRNRYAAFLTEIVGGAFVTTLEEGAEVSRYRVGATDLRFQTRAEAHFPVALASMVSKYVRELSMIPFNRYWQQQVPGLAPTKGYPLDARRFRRDIAHAQARLGITDEVLWREK